MNKLQIISSGIVKNNPTFVLVLGMCPTLGTTTSAENGMGMGLATTVSTSAAEIAIVIALGCSLGMCLPISTPPNAIAYSTGTTPTREMAIVGIVVGVIGIILLAFVAPLTWGFIGVM